MKAILKLTLTAILIALTGLYSCKKTEVKPEPTPEPTPKYYSPYIPPLRVFDNYSNTYTVPTNMYFRTRSGSELIDSISLGANLYVYGFSGNPGELCSAAPGSFNSISLKAINNQVFTMEVCAVKSGTLAILAFYNFDASGNIQNAGPSTTSIHGSKGYKSSTACNYIGIDF